MDLESFPVLEAPPLAEVVCGVIFEPLQALDVMLLGVYWDQRREEYPQRALLPALVDGTEFVLGGAQMRAMLTSGDTVRVLQAQHDRFFMNWRAVGEAYPRFSGETGLRACALNEFDRFSQFCVARQLGTPKARRIELSKVDVISSPKHWQGLDDLAAVVPITGTLRHADHATSREFGLQFIEYDDGGQLIVSVNAVVDRPGGNVHAARIETRALRTVGDTPDLSGAFAAANKIVNRAFFKLVAQNELHRFNARSPQ